MRISVAVELEGALELGEELKKRGVIAAIGHSDATYAKVAKAVEAGYSFVTHLYSGMSALHRVGPYRVLGVVESAYLFDELGVEIISDGKHLPPELLTYVAGKLGISEAKAYSVATFYENFSFEPKGKYVIKVCDGTACHVRKSMPVKEALMKELGLSNKKHTTDDMLFTVETVSCLGACGLAPTLTVNDEVHPKMTPEKAIDLLNELRGETV